MKKHLLFSLLFLFIINLSAKADLVVPLNFEISSGSILYDKLPVLASMSTPFTASFGFAMNSSGPRSIDIVIFHRGIDGTDTPISNSINIIKEGSGPLKLYTRTVYLVLPAGFTTGKIMIKYRYEGETIEHFTNYSIPLILIPSPNMMPLMRMFNPNAGRHVITASVKEKRDLMNIGWQYEGDYGLVKIAPDNSYFPLYRFYRSRADDHAFQPNNPTPPPGYDSEGTACYVLVSPGADTRPIYAFYNTKSGDRMYVGDAGELNGVKNWQYEGIPFYVQ